MTQKNKRLLLAFITFLMLNSISSWSHEQQLNILIINSYHQDYPWTLGQNKAFKKHIKKQLPYANIKFTTENLNTKQVAPTEEYHQSFINYFHVKYRQNLPDLIYVTDDNATNFVIEHIKDIHHYANVPIVFSGVNNLQLFEKYTKPSNITGVFEFKNLESNVALLKKLNVQFNSVLWVGDGGTSDSEITKQSKQVKQKYPNINIKRIAHNQLSQLLHLINEQPPAPIIITSVGKLKDNSGSLVSPEQTINALAETKRLILVTEDGYFLKNNNPILGGYLTTSTSQGKVAAKLAAQTIHQQSADNIPPFNEAPVELVIDWLLLDKLNLSLPEKLNASARILNKPQPFLAKNSRKMIWLISSLLIIFLFGLIISISLNRQKRLVIKKQTTDPLTGLTNRIGLAQAIKDIKCPVIALLDINDFNALSNFYGPITADAIIIKLANYLRSNLLSNVSLFHISHDQFVLVIDRHGTDININDIVANIITHFKQHDLIEQGIKIRISLSAGISSIDSKSPLIEANAALAYAKNKHEHFVTYKKNDRIAKQQHQNILWAQKLRKALSEKRVQPFYQAIVNNKTGKATKVEALVRLINEDNSVVSPFFFLDAAKKSHQYEELTHTVLMQSIKAIENNEMTVSVNFTVEDTQNIKTFALLKELVTTHRCGNRVIIELTESEGIENYQQAVDFIKDVKQLGCKVAIDDFGTGYSNFMHIVSLNADILKIDGSIIQAILTDNNAEVIVKTLVTFAKQLGMETVAEFVDSQEILDKVTELDVDYSQGFYLSKPEPEIIPSPLSYFPLSEN